MRLAAYFRKPKRGRETDSIIPTDRGWELITSAPRQNSRVLVTCKGLLDRIIEKEEELGEEEFKVLSGYNSSDFMEDIGEPVVDKVVVDEGEPVVDDDQEDGLDDEDNMDSEDETDSDDETNND